MRAVVYLTGAVAERAAGDECRSRGWTVAATERDEERPGPALGRPGLRRALDAIAEGRAAAIVVARLDALGRDAAELSPVLSWLEQQGARLVALEPALDTGRRADARAAELLAEVGAWRRAGDHGPRRGRPAVADHPELAARIAALRAEGLSLRAIAGRLNDEGVPTLRGGARWRASSVQSAAGYRRPAPGPPLGPPHPPAPPHPPRGPHPGKGPRR
jgi:resolvase-like protein/recombinase